MLSLSSEVIIFKNMLLNAWVSTVMHVLSPLALKVDYSQHAA